MSLRLKHANWQVGTAFGGEQGFGGPEEMGQVRRKGIDWGAVFAKLDSSPLCSGKEEV